MASATPNALPDSRLQVGDVLKLRPHEERCRERNWCYLQVQMYVVMSVGERWDSFFKRMWPYVVVRNPVYPKSPRRWHPHALLEAYYVAGRAEIRGSKRCPQFVFEKEKNMSDEHPRDCLCDSCTGVPILDDEPYPEPIAMPPTAISVMQPWTMLLPLQQQAVLLLACRGPDGIAKWHDTKQVQVAYRACVLTAARNGRALRWGERAGDFMSLVRFSDPTMWDESVTRFFNVMDALPHHYLTHFMHGAQVLGYKHPDKVVRDRWLNFYVRVVESFHLQLENEATMDARLNDWNREGWST